MFCLQHIRDQLAQQELISRQNSPLTVSVVSVRYAEAAALQQSLTKFLTAANGQGGQAAVIEVDEHSNALIIQATEQDQQRIIRLVDNLDRPRPQVHLKAYIVEATKETARELGVQWGGVWRSGSFNNGNHAWIGSGASGTQGQDPGFDPLALLVDAAHARDLQLEAWVNPYRIQAGQTPALCGASPARLHPDWVRYTDTGTYLDPASADVRQYIADGVGELCARYAVDGIHFDDYFYPTTDPAFDAADYAASGSTRTQDDWRRENVNALMELCHAAARRYGVRFGAAPAGDPEQNYTLQYSDAARWLRQGTVDYLMPQLYWGQEYIKNGDASHSFAQLAAAWAALPRAAGVKLYAGLGAYRVGAGDGSDAGSEWFSGHALADQLALLARLGVQGAGLYRYGSLFANSGAPALAESEAEAIKGVWQG